MKTIRSLLPAVASATLTVVAVLATRHTAVSPAAIAEYGIGGLFAVGLFGLLAYELRAGGKRRLASGYVAEEPIVCAPPSPLAAARSFAAPRPAARRTHRRPAAVS